MSRPKQLSKSPQPRAHFILFAKNSPFKPRSVESKTQYQRQPKHRTQGVNYE